MDTSRPEWYSRQGLWSLFLICVFPTHVWTIVLAFRDFSWIAERTNLWDSIGVLAYGLVFAFIESLAVALVLVLLGFLVPRRWGERKRIPLLSALVLLAAFWIILSQLYSLLGLSLPGDLIRFLAGSNHPVRIMYAASFVLLAPTFLLQTYLILRSDKVFRFFEELIARLSLLSSFYLVLDLVGLVIIISRNL